MLTTLSQCIKVYETLNKCRYVLTLEDGSVVRFQFSNDHFYHLLGLHKLTDVPQLQKQPGKQSASTIYKNLKTGKINGNVISQSAFLFRIVNRITHFDLFPQLLSDCKIIVDFDVEKVAFDSELKNTRYILYKRLDDGTILHFTLKLLDNGMASPETFFVQQDNAYLSDQMLLDVINITVEKVGKKGSQ